MPLPKSRIGKLSENEYESVTRYVLAVHGVTWAPGQDPATVQLVP
jgi:hypothetical protein